MHGKLNFPQEVLSISFSKVVRTDLKSKKTICKAFSLHRNFLVQNWGKKSCFFSAQKIIVLQSCLHAIGVVSDCFRD